MSASVLEELKLSLEEDDLSGFLDMLSLLSVQPGLAKQLCDDLDEILLDDCREFVVGPWGYICLTHKN